MCWRFLKSRVGYILFSPRFSDRHWCAQTAGLAGSVLLCNTYRGVTVRGKLLLVINRTLLWTGVWDRDAPASESALSASMRHWRSWSHIPVADRWCSDKSMEGYLILRSSWAKNNKQTNKQKTKSCFPRDGIHHKAAASLTSLIGNDFSVRHCVLGFEAVVALKDNRSWTSL